MLALPRNAEDVISVADWLELVALESGDQNASSGDLINALQIPLGKKKAQEISLEVLLEIEDRIKGADKAYPFEIRGSNILQAKQNLKEYVAYIFCLLLSYFGWIQKKKAPNNPRLLFEDLASVAAKQYIQGEVIKFGTSRRNSGVSGFGEAIQLLCLQLGEGQGLRPNQTLSKQDDHVDLVVWKGFDDGRESKLILFGQCATGENWTGKVTELQPDPFWDHWMLEPKVSPLGRSFYIPHRVPYREEWIYHARYAGILFDRCRVAYWSWRDNDSVLSDSRFIDWCIFTFPVLKKCFSKVAC